MKKLLLTIILIYQGLSQLNAQNCGECEWMIEKSSGNKVLNRSISDRYIISDRYTYTGSYDEFCCKEYKKVFAAYATCIAKGVKVTKEGFNVKEWHCPSGKTKLAESKDESIRVSYYENGKLEFKKNFNTTRTEYTYVEYDENGKLLLKGKYLIFPGFLDQKDGEWFEDGKTVKYVKGRNEQEVEKRRQEKEERDQMIKTKFENCQTLENYEFFVSMYGDSEYATKAREIIDQKRKETKDYYAIKLEEYNSIMALKKSDKLEDIQTRITKAEAFLSDYNNTEFFKKGNYTSYLEGLIGSSRVALPKQAYSDCFTYSNKAACQIYLDLSANDYNAAAYMEAARKKIKEIEKHEKKK